MSRGGAQDDREADADAEGLHVLLIEDNPGDARLIREMLQSAEELAQRVDPGGIAGATPELVHESRLEDGTTYLESNPVDVVLLDLNLPDSQGLDTLRETLEVVEWTPVVVLTGVRDQAVGVEAIERGAQDYLVKGEVTDDLLVRSIHHAIERNRQNRERERRRQQLRAINRLNEISQDVTHNVIKTSSREELEQRVCDRLVESDAYRFAWIGDVQRGGNEVVPKVSAGEADGYLEEITITTDDGATGSGPTGQAVETHEVQVVQDTETDPSFEPWRERARQRGYRSSAVVPIVHDGLLYGVLNVYATEPNAFTDSQVRILDGLGDIVGHAIAAIDRKDALVTDSVLELDFRIEGVAEPLIGLSREVEGTVRIERLLQRDDAVFAYGTASDVPRERFLEAAERVEWFDAVRVLSPGYDDYEFEIRTTGAVSIVDTLATHGGRIAEATIADGEFRIVAELPHGIDTRRVIEAIEDDCDGAEYVAQRTTTRSDDGLSDYRSVLEQLTEKQREALEMAVFAGYFDWPRESTGEDVAERLGVSPATFAQHLRAAQRKFFDAVFDR